MAVRRWIVGIGVAAVAAAGGAFLVSQLGGGLFAPPALPPVIVALQAHLRSVGLDGRADAVKNLESHATYRILFQATGADAPRFQVFVCRDEASAQRELERLKVLEPTSRPERNALLVLFVADQPDAPAMERVREAFRRFVAPPGTE